MKFCSDCSQCRGNEVGGWYCRRSYIDIEEPDECVACDDFEQEN